MPKVTSWRLFRNGSALFKELVCTEISASSSRGARKNTTTSEVAITARAQMIHHKTWMPKALTTTGAPLNTISMPTSTQVDQIAIAVARVLPGNHIAMTEDADTAHKPTPIPVMMRLASKIPKLVPESAAMAQPAIRQMPATIRTILCPNLFAKGPATTAAISAVIAT